MNNYLKVLITAIVIIMGVYFYYQKVGTPIDTTDKAEVLTEGSIVGCYVAHLSKDIYTLNIQTDNKGEVVGMLAYNNYEKDSSSGSFKGTYKDGILLGNYFFQSEGMDSVRQVIFKKEGDSFIQGFGPVKLVDGNETFDSISLVTYDVNSTFTKSNNCLEKFTDSSKTVTFEYNPIFKSTGNSIPTIDWRLDTKEKGVLLASVIIPKAFMPETNFSDAKLTIGRATSVNAIKSCINDVTSGQVKGAVVTISGYPFTKYSSSGAGAGNLYETTSYRGIIDGDCYAVEYTIHSTNIGNYPPKQNIKEFDEKSVQDNLEKIIQSLKFVVSGESSIKNSGISIGELGQFNTVSIRPLSVEEDSRCPMDVNCIQAGTVRLKIDVISKSGTSSSIVKLGQEFTTANVRIILTDVTPVPNSKINISSKDYRFLFKVTKQDAPIIISAGRCFVGGCSSQICSDKADVVSTCEYKEEYSCYKTAKCERQSTGSCGWTQTPELNACLLGN